LNNSIIRRTAACKSPGFTARNAKNRKSRLQNNRFWNQFDYRLFFHKKQRPRARDCSKTEVSEQFRLSLQNNCGKLEFFQGKACPAAAGP
jgi:hypothetical protein